MSQHRRLHPSDHPEGVERDLREPLLVDPVGAERPGRERVRTRQSVGHDFPAAGERQPGVLNEFLREEVQDNAEVDGNEAEQSRLALQPA